MFTGIIEQVAKIDFISNTSNEYIMSINLSKYQQDLKIGDSVCVNGVCLTISEIKNELYYFNLSPETIKLTTLSGLKENCDVNIELPLTLSKFISGHITTGHIDSVGTVKNIDSQKDSWLLEIEIEKKFKKYIVKKGSIAIDGISLTINEVSDTSIFLMIIPHTYENTCIKKYKTGIKVNIEYDYIAKHIEMLKHGKTLLMLQQKLMLVY